MFPKLLEQQRNSLKIKAIMSFYWNIWKPQGIALSGKKTEFPKKDLVQLTTAAADSNWSENTAVQQNCIVIKILVGTPGFMVE